MEMPTSQASISTDNHHRRADVGQRWAALARSGGDYDRTKNVGGPKANKTQHCKVLGSLGPTQLATKQSSSQMQNAEASDGACRKNADRRSKISSRDHEPTGGVRVSIPHPTVRRRSPVGLALERASPPVVLLGLEVHEPVDRADGPREPQAQEDVHRVGSSNVPNGVVCVRVLLGSCLRGKGIRQGGPQGHQRDSCNFILDAQDTPERSCDVPNSRGHNPDVHERHAEAKPTAHKFRGGNRGEE
mmetsp:Transcript_40319/g.105911  ORF Transcript_40319/g.105911 Transcript_40319/m.105911 type:complete len:245 (-) Transcript_40319:453-1187(-)